MKQDNPRLSTDVAIQLVWWNFVISVGVFWAAWSVHGFWWGLLYGLGWKAWLGFRLATYLLS